MAYNIKQENDQYIKDIPFENEYIQQFDIICMLGKGSFCTVFKVKRKKDNQIYALKMMKLGKCSKHQRQSALYEVQFMASLDSSSIIKYHQTFYDNPSQSLFLVMEYMSGGDIQQLIQKHHTKQFKLIDEDLIWEYAIQMIHGLKILHQANIVHRDFKSANVFLQKEGNICKIGDFNVSLHLKQGLITIQGGTPNYSAPEVWSSKPHDYKCDSWSLGCIIYEMCQGTHPFQGETMDDLYQSVQKVQYKQIPQVYSQEMVDLISLLLVHNPQKRASMKDLLQKDFILQKIQYIIHKNPQLSYLKSLLYLKQFSNQGSPSSRNSTNDTGNIYVSCNSDDHYTQLLKTMYLPKDLQDIPYLLPQPKYELDIKEEKEKIKQQLIQQQKNLIYKNQKNIQNQRQNQQMENQPQQQEQQQNSRKIVLSCDRKNMKQDQQQYQNNIKKLKITNFNSVRNSPVMTPNLRYSQDYGMFKTGFNNQQSNKQKKSFQKMLYNYLKQEQSYTNENSGKNRKYSCNSNNDLENEEIDVIQQKQLQNLKHKQNQINLNKKNPIHAMSVQQQNNFHVKSIMKNTNQSQISNLIKTTRSKSIQPSATIRQSPLKLPHVQQQQISQQNSHNKNQIIQQSFDQRKQLSKNSQKQQNELRTVAHSVEYKSHKQSQNQQLSISPFQSPVKQSQQHAKSVQNQNQPNNFNFNTLGQQQQQQQLQKKQQNQFLNDNLLPKTVNIQNLRNQFEKNQQLFKQQQIQQQTIFNSNNKGRKLVKT